MSSKRLSATQRLWWLVGAGVLVFLVGIVLLASLLSSIRKLPTPTAMPAPTNTTKPIATSTGLGAAPIPTALLTTPVVVGTNTSTPVPTVALAGMIKIGVELPGGPEPVDDRPALTSAELAIEQ